MNQEYYLFYRSDYPFEDAQEAEQSGAESLRVRIPAESRLVDTLRYMLKFLKSCPMDVENDLGFPSFTFQHGQIVYGGCIVTDNPNDIRLSAQIVMQEDEQSEPTSWITPHMSVAEFFSRLAEA